MPRIGGTWRLRWGSWPAGSPLHSRPPRWRSWNVLAEVEAGLDFPDENISFLTCEQLGERLTDARRQID